MISYKCSPGKWSWGLIPLALPFLGAWFLNTPILLNKLSRTAELNLKTSEIENLTVKMAGRDVVLSGQTDSRKVIDDAIKSLLPIKGVRRVDVKNILIVKPVVLDLPTINPVSGNNNKPVITGTWPNSVAKTLSVKAGNKTYILGKDNQLTSDSKGKWALKLTQALTDGSHDIVVSITDSKKAAALDNTKGEVTIDTTPPAAPVFTSKLATKNTQPTISGTYALNDTRSLTVTLADKEYTLGKDKALSVDGKGGWSLTPPKALLDGKYDLTVKTADELGNISSSTTSEALSIDTSPPAAPKVTSSTNANTTPVFKGTWVEETGNKLKVVVAGKIFSLGRDKQLTSDGNGNWTLSLTQPLGEGNHSVLVETADAFGNLARSPKPTIITVDTVKPAKPTINKTATRTKTPKISGTWSQDAKSNLSVVFDSKTYTLGQNPELSADSNGNWLLQTGVPLADGRYKVAATVTKKTGTSTTATLGEAVIIDTTPPPPPTVTTILTRHRTPLITGTWDSSDAVTLNVTVAGQSYSAAKQGEITINGDHWSIKPANPIADGSYDVVVIVEDKLGNQSRDAGKAELLIDGTPPVTPTVRPVFGTSLRPNISGTWVQDDNNTLSVTIAESTYTPTKGGPLVVDDQGNWTLTLPQDLKPGRYDVQVKVADRLGNQSNDISNDEVWIKLAPPKPVAIVKKPKTPSLSQCQTKFTAALAGQSIVFKTNKAQITETSNGLIANLATIAKACPSARVEISGHTDSQGSATYNQSLSEARASSVVDALVLRGIAKSRLRAVGHGQKRPVAPNSTNKGRALNRRIEFRVEN